MRHVWAVWVFAIGAVEQVAQAEDIAKDDDDFALAGPEPEPEAPGKALSCNSDGSFEGCAGHWRLTIGDTLLFLLCFGLCIIGSILYMCASRPNRDTL